MLHGGRWPWTPLFGGAVLTASGLGLAAHGDRIGREAERLVPADGAFIDVAGARLHYLDRGSGPAILMVHGLGGQLRNFSYALLERLVADHRVILVDRPGSGYSTATGGMAPRIAAQGAIIGELIDGLKLDRPLLVGHSLGGAVALALALERPTAMSGLALIAPLTQHQRDVPAAFRALALMPAALRQAMAQTLIAPLGKLMEEHTAAAVFAPDVPPTDFSARGGGALAFRPAALAAAAADLASAGDDMAGLAARYPTLKVPTAILFGRDDCVLDPERHGARTAAVIAGARFETIAGGHMIPVTAPDAVAAFILAAARMSTAPA